MTYFKEFNHASTMKKYIFQCMHVLRHFEINSSIRKRTQCIFQIKENITKTFCD